MQISSKLSNLRWDFGGIWDFLRRLDKIVFNSSKGTEPKRFDASKETNLQFLEIVILLSLEISSRVFSTAYLLVNFVRVGTVSDNFWHNL